MHFTHSDNLPQIIAEGALCPDAHVGGRLIREVGDRSIKAARRTNDVTCAPGGHPADYVPFYFAPRSPMLYRIARSGVDHYQDGQTPLIYLVSTIGNVIRSGLPWVASTGNCGAVTTEYFNDPGLLDTKIDWDLQDATMWSDTAEDPYRATRRAAEFLVHERLPWQLIRWVVTRTPATASTVRSTLTAAGLFQTVVVRPRWYYNGRKYR
jgi:hypothetical protein